jgi:hypothetical protein
MKSAILSLIAAFLLTVPSVFSQTKFSVRPVAIVRGEAYGYSAFLGPDAGSFKTSINGFGSGLLDVLAGRGGIDLVAIGGEKLFLSTGLGYGVSKFRFAENMVPSLSGEGVLSFAVDPDSRHDYVNTFFGYGKTKLVTSVLYIPLTINLNLGENLLITAGGLADWQFFSKFKMKYLMDDVKVKEVMKSADMKDYPFNRFRYGIHAGLYHKKLQWGISGSYFFTPMFKENLGPQIHECRISLLYSVSDETQKLKSLKK